MIFVYMIEPLDVALIDCSDPRTKKAAVPEMPMVALLHSHGPLHACVVPLKYCATSSGWWVVARISNGGGASNNEREK